MSMLYYYAKKVVETGGVLHKLMVHDLRMYIKTTPEDQLVKEIMQLNEIPLLRALWEAGLNARLQRIVLARTEELARRQGR